MIVGIDIGTSYSSICIMGPDGKAQPVDISTGTSMYGSKYSLPSAVFIEESGNILVGQAAMSSRKVKPQNFHMEFKRDLGQDIPILLGQSKFLPEDLYTELFRHMKTRAEKTYGERIEKAYLTYPASFGNKKKEKILSAAKAAGLFNVELVDEPTAAAMSYCAAGLVEDGQTLLVYDFGGGTFDVSIIRYEDGRFTLLAQPDGLEHCGGIDVDRLIYQDMLGKIDPDTLGEFYKKPLYRMRLESQISELAVKAKHHLSFAESYQEYIELGLDMIPYELTAEKLNEMIAPLVGQTISVCRSILKSAELSVSDLSAILMVGGTSRIPLVQKMVRQFAGKVPVLSSIDLELAVAQGAIGFYNQQKRGEPQKGILERYCERNNSLVSASAGCIFAIKSDGTLLIDGTMQGYEHKLTDWKELIAIAGNAWHTIGLKKSGTLTAVGDNTYAQCDVYHWRDIKAVACGRWHTVGLKEDGTVIATGRNFDNQCNIGKWRDITAIACGEARTVGLKSDGTVIMTKDNDTHNVEHWHDIVRIAAGEYQVVGLKEDGTAEAYGTNGYGQCDVKDWSGIIEVACGRQHTVGLKHDGTVIATGRNDLGQCNVEDWRGIIGIWAVGDRTIGLQKDGSIRYTDYHVLLHETKQDEISLSQKKASEKVF
ncbi:Hsp70 family protein [[Clostridium] leptum]|nr:Hsp70 family protein [[Clostridium] leptum]